MKEKDVKNITIGDIFYKQSKYDCKSCYRVEVVEILNEQEVMVRGMTRNKKGERAPAFKTYISTLHKSPGKAVSGYKQHHR